MVERKRLPKGGAVIDIWLLSMGDGVAGLENTADFLSDDERHRMAAFTDPRVAQRFAQRRRLLRDVLARYLEIDPSVLDFAYGATGKPRLRQDGGADNLVFNASDTADEFIIAIVRGVEVGIDIERLRDLDYAVAMADRFFAADEAEALSGLPSADRAAAVLTCWVRKEAVMKAHGGGMRLGLKTIEVGFAPMGPEGVSVEADGRRFTVKDLAVGAEYVAALAAEVPDFEVEYHGFG